MSDPDNSAPPPSLMEMRRRWAEEDLRTIPGLAKTLMKIAGPGDVENERMGVPTKEELIEMQAQRYSPIQRRGFTEGKLSGDG